MMTAELRRMFTRRTFCSAAALTFALSLAACSASDKSGEPKSIVAKPPLAEEELLINAMDTYDKGLFTVSEKNWADLRDGYPSSYFSVLAELKMADAAYFRAEFAAALAGYEDFARMHPGHEAIPYVRYQIANCSLEQYRGELYDQAPLQSAMKAFEQLMLEFPASEYAIFARRNLDRCRGYQAQHEKAVAQFYHRRGAEKASEMRLATLKVLYPESEAVQGIADDEEPLEMPERVDSGLTERFKGSYAPSKPEFVLKNPSDPARWAPAPAKELPAPPLILSSAPTTSPASTAPVASAPKRTSYAELRCFEQDSGSVFEVMTQAPVIGHSRIVNPDGSSLITLKLGQGSTTEAFGAREELAATELSTNCTSKSHRAVIAEGGPRSDTIRVHIDGAITRLSVIPLERPFRAGLFVR